MMKPIVFCVTFFCFCAPPVHWGSLAKAENPRRYHEILSDLSSAMRREARANTFAERARAVKDLCDVYLELQRDPRTETSETLQGYKRRARSRLVRVKKDLERKLARQSGSPKRSSRQKRARIRTQAAQSRFSGQQGNDYGVEDSLEDKNRQATVASAKTMAVQMEFYASMMGGPGQLANDGGRAFGGGAVPDTSAELIDLIQSVIAPDFWDVNGGPGTILYYRPLHVLVVRATAEVHGRVGGVLGGVRAAGK